MKAEKTIICKILEPNKGKLVALKEEYDIKDSKILKRDYGFELHLSVLKEVELVETYKGALGVDLGLDKFATCIRLPDRQTHYYSTHVTWPEATIDELPSRGLCC